MSDRVKKVNHLIQEEVGSYLQTQIPLKTGIVTITAVETTPDLKNSTIWYSYIGGFEKDLEAALKKHLRPLQAELNHKLYMKNVPKITFRRDNSGDYAQKISKIIDENI